MVRLLPIAAHIAASASGPSMASSTCSERAPARTKSAAAFGSASVGNGTNSGTGGRSVVSGAGGS